ncbi:MAG: hypothetical protein WCW53_04115 [Syntrophales bacterium]
MKDYLTLKRIAAARRGRREDAARLPMMMCCPMHTRHRRWGGSFM